MKLARAFELALPTFLTGEEFRPMVVTGVVVFALFAALAVKVEMDNAGKRTDSNIMTDSKTNMREFLVAILEDNNRD